MFKMFILNKITKQQPEQLYKTGLDFYCLIHTLLDWQENLFNNCTLSFLFAEYSSKIKAARWRFLWNYDFVS